MRDEQPSNTVRRTFALSRNARVSLALAGLALAFYIAVYLNHLLP